MLNKRKRVPVEINGKIYDSIVAGAEAMGWKPQCLIDAFRAGKSILKGYSIKRLDNKTYPIRNKISIKNKENKRNCPVLCITTGEVFRSISDAAESCNSNAWTMGLKMAKAGKFIDSNGKEYIRQKDAKYSREYPKQTPSLQRTISKHKRNSNTNININTINNNLVSTISKSNLSSSDEKALSTITANMIQNKQYNEALVLLNILRNNI